MKDVPLKAEVTCSDGSCGQSTSVIVDPETLQVTHIVVKERQRPHEERLVPIDQVQETTSRSIRLGCTAEELKAMKPFTQTEYHQVEIPQYVGADPAAPYNYPEIVTLSVERELVPEGMNLVRPDAKVEATDGTVGRVERLITDSNSGQITHFILQAGHLWGNKAIVMPLSVVDSAAEETVYLKLDKQTIASMLAIPAKQSYDIANDELVALVFDQSDKAEQALKVVRGLKKEAAGSIHNAAVVVKEKNGKLSLREIDDVDSRRGTVFGAVSGGLIGLLGGPVGVIVGATAGAVTARIAAKRIDMGFSDEYLKKLQENLQPDSSALLLFLTRERTDEILAALSEFEGRPVRQTLTDDMLARLVAEIEGS